MSDDPGRRVAGGRRPERVVVLGRWSSGGLLRPRPHPDRADPRRSCSRWRRGARRWCRRASSPGTPSGRCRSSCAGTAATTRAWPRSASGSCARSRAAASRTSSPSTRPSCRSCWQGPAGGQDAARVPPSSGATPPTSCRRRRWRSWSHWPQALGMTAGIGTRAVVEDGVYTGELAGPFCYGAGQGDAITEVAALGGLRPQPLLRLQRLGQRPAHAGGGGAPGRGQPGRPPGSGRGRGEAGPS